MTSDAPVTPASRAEGPLPRPFPHRTVRTSLAMSADTRMLMRGIFGPSRWCSKAAQVLQVSRRMAYRLASGERLITARHRAVMLAYADRRVENLIQEQLGEVRALNDLYRRAKLDLQAARRILDKRTQ